jgi:hypothetical protein
MQRTGEERRTDMAKRLTPEEWEQARALHEVCGEGFREIGRRFGISDAAVRKRAKSEGRVRNGSSLLAEAKVAACRALADAEEESSRLPKAVRDGIDAACVERDARSRMALAIYRECARRTLAPIPEASADEPLKLAGVGEKVEGNATQAATIVSVQAGTGVVHEISRDIEEALRELGPETAPPEGTTQARKAVRAPMQGTERSQDLAPSREMASFQDSMPSEESPHPQDQPRHTQGIRHGRGAFERIFGRSHG